MQQGAEVLAEPGEVFRFEPEQGLNSREIHQHMQGILEEVKAAMLLRGHTAQSYHNGATRYCAILYINKGGFVFLCCFHSCSTKEKSVWHLIYSQCEDVQISLWSNWHFERLS